MPRCLPMLTSFFDRLLMGFCSQLRPPEPHGSSPRCSESTIYQKIAFRNLHRLFIDFGANMPPFSLPKSTKIVSKINLGRHQFFDRFLHRFFIDFCSILEANLAPCWPLFLQNVGNHFLVHPPPCWIYVLFRFFGRPGSLLAPFGLDLGSSGARFWKVFGLDIGRFLGSILTSFELCFGSFWQQFGHTTPLGKPALSIHSAGVWFWMGWWGYAKRKEFDFYKFRKSNVMPGPVCFEATNL